MKLDGYGATVVDNAAFNGNRTINPFNFYHYNLSEIALYHDGH